MDENELNEAWEFNHQRKPEPVPISFKPSSELIEAVDRLRAGTRMSRGLFIKTFLTATFVIAKGQTGNSRSGSRRETA